MKLEDLNKTQMVLLTLLTTFIVSIGTSIVTVSLLQVAPVNVTRNINQVVERTVEKVVPSVTVGGKPTTIKETTVVVKDDDLIAKSIESARKNMVQVRGKSVNAEGLAVNTFLGWGVIFNQDGVIVTDSSFISDSGTYTVLLSDGMEFGVEVLTQDEEKGVAVLKAQREKGNTNQEQYKFESMSAGDASKLHLGQTVVSLGGSKSKQAISISTVNSLSTQTASSTTTISGIDTGVVTTGSVSGGPLINSFGEMVGLLVAGGVHEQGTTFVSENVIDAIVARATK